MFSHYSRTNQWSADTQASRQFMFARLFSTRKRTNPKVNGSSFIINMTIPKYTNIWGNSFPVKSYHFWSRYFWTQSDARNDWHEASSAKSSGSILSKATADCLRRSTAKFSSLRKHWSIIAVAYLSNWLKKTFIRYLLNSIISFN